MPEKRFYETLRDANGELYSGSHANSGFFDGPIRHLLARDGSLYAWTEWGTGGCTGTLGVFRFDGKRWMRYDLANGFVGELVRYVVSLPDSTVGVILQNETELRLWCPDAADLDRKGVATTNPGAIRWAEV